MPNKKNLIEVEHELQELLIQLSTIQDRIREKLGIYSDGKNLKGNEIVGWLGEIYGKLFYDGQLVSDREEHDFITPENWRISVKARKGWSPSWRQTSAIPKIDGEDSPTHLLFVHLNDDYSVDRMWLFVWKDLLKCSRFKEHNVRGSRRSYIFKIVEEIDNLYLVYSKTQEEIKGNQHRPNNSSSARGNESTNEKRIESNTKERANKWLRKYHPNEMRNKTYASKFHSGQKIWFFTFPTTFFKQGNVDHLNILCESQANPNEFCFLKVPYSFFQDNQDNFSIRRNGTKFDLHLSAKNKNWMIDERSKTISFEQFLVA